MYTVNNGINSQEYNKLQIHKLVNTENLKILRLDQTKSTNGQFDKGSNIKLEYVVNCWIKGVESYLTCRHPRKTDSL